MKSKFDYVCCHKMLIFGLTQELVWVIHRYKEIKEIKIFCDFENNDFEKFDCFELKY